MADIVFVGEVHDSALDHARETAIIKTLHETGKPLAIGLEMFRADNQQVLDEWVRGGVSLNEFLSVYYENWRQPWNLYRGIFLYARDHRIPLVGLNIPDEITERVARRGFGSLTEIEKHRLPDDVKCDVDATYLDYIRKAYAGHRNLPGRQFLNFCEAQLVWDKAMARRILQYLGQNPGVTMIVLTGLGHAWKRGIPRDVVRLSKYTILVILLDAPGAREPEEVSREDADYVIGW